MLIVSLTTTYQRLNFCKIALSSILLQSVQPAKILLWISSDPYLRDDGFLDQKEVMAMLEDLSMLDNDKLTVHWTENTGPYRKLLPVLQESSDEDLIVTADDDIFYGQRWLEKLLANHERDILQATASRVRRIDKNTFGKSKAYMYWDLVSHKCILKDEAIVTFGGGAVLEKSMFLSCDISDKEFLKIAPTTDDLWFSKLLKRNNVSVKVCPKITEELFFIEHGNGLIGNNFPQNKSLISKVRSKYINKYLGWFGIAISNNDTSYKRIEKYFTTKDH